MTKTEYNEVCDNCRFIRRSLQFYSKQDFIQNKEYIKLVYKELEPIGKEVYMYYVFSKRYLNFKTVTRIWDYLNDYVDTIQ